MQTLKEDKEDKIDLNKPGIYSITNNEYHSGPGISRSQIMEFKKSPRHYWYKYINPDYVKKPSTVFQEFGTAFHTYILEPDKFKNEYQVMAANPFHGNSIEGRKFKTTQLLCAQGKKPISTEDYNRLKKMADGLYSHDRAKKLVTGALYETSFFWHDADTGLLCKARPDIWHKEFVVDLKSATDISKRAFNYTFYDYGNYIQCAMIQTAIQTLTGKYIEKFLNLAVETVEPYCPALYPVAPQYIELGVQEYKHYLKKIKECMDTNSWPSYPNEPLDVPKYAISEWQS